ncbi:hypothetical protein VTN77DRAFT_5169 [Rasamsonia byssochlamydoides]|uniref:uncharacterized protein n=1 Tax=Rasamsonia byssochlamydoides TaxID=89139 RepID=UPI003743C0FF
MDDKINDTSFVVITGHPQRGKSERISRVRSHITKQYHRQKHRRRKQAEADEANLAMMPINQMSSGMLREIGFALDPSRLFLSEAVFWRMQSFVYQYLQSSREAHPFFRTVIPASISHVPLISAKILNASAWDDLNGAGGISDVTLHQRSIALSLLNDALANLDEACSDVNIAAMMSFLTFDFVNENREAFNQQKRGIQRIIRLRGGVEKLGFEGHLKNSILIMEELQRVVKNFADSDASSRAADRSPSPSHPPDFNVFTFRRGQDAFRESKISPSIIHLLSDLYRLVMLSRECCHSASLVVRQRIFAEWTLIHDRLLTTLKAFSSSSYKHNNSADDYNKAAVLLHAALLFSSYSGFASYDADYGRIITTEFFQTLLRQTDIDTYWGPLPGALIWCLVIGARLSRPESPMRKWFLMQVTRITFPLALDECDEVLGSLRMILGGMEAVESQKDENGISWLKRMT